MRLQFENMQLQQKIQAMEFKVAMLGGHPKYPDDAPIPWSDDVPDHLRPEAFEGALAEVLQARADPGLSVQAIDCEEYPCIAVFRGSGSLDHGVIGSLGAHLAHELGGEGLGFKVVTSRTSDPAQPRAIGLVVFPPGADAEALSNRGSFRANRIMQGGAAEE